MSKFFVVLAVIVLIIGTISGWVVGSNPNLKDWDDVDSDDFCFGIAIQVWVIFDAFAFALFYYGFSLNRLDELVINSRHTDKGKFISSDAVNNGNYWVCSTCGRLNTMAVGVCGCGQMKPGTFTAPAYAGNVNVNNQVKKAEPEIKVAETVKMASVSEQSQETEMVMCPLCGTTQAKGRTYCSGCGQKFIT